jgi:HSP20 family protein
MMTMYLAPYRRQALRQAYDARIAPHIHIPVDVRAEEDTYVITALVPGLSAEDVQLEILENVLTISGEFQAAEAEDEDKSGCLLREIPNGEFKRVLRLPTDLDATKAEAAIQDGVLTLRVAKAEYALPKQIKVIAK